MSEVYDIVHVSLVVTEVVEDHCPLRDEEFGSVFRPSTSLHTRKLS